MPLGTPIQSDGDAGFIGMASRDNPSAIAAGYVQYAQNLRFDRGVASVRSGSRRLTAGDAVGQVIYGSGVWSDPATGAEKIVLLGGTALYAFDADTGGVTRVDYPAGQTIAVPDAVDAFQANQLLYIMRGQDSGKSPLIWDGVGTITVAPSAVTSGASANFPPADFGLYFQNRIVVKRDRDQIAASDLLDFNTWDLTFNQWQINLGSNDFIVGFQPWQEDKFIIFQRNSIQYAYIDPNGYAAGAGPGGGSYVKSLTSEIGCVARRSIVGAGENLFFLSDSGVHLLTPSLDLKLLGNQRPLSEPISDLIARINAAAVASATGVIFNNRYYLSVPLDDAVRNNAVLVYSLLNKAWESLDTYPAGMFLDQFHVVRRGQSRRLFAVNAEGGIYLLEELTQDEFGIVVGNPILPFTLPAILDVEFVRHNIAGQLLTRRYTFGTFQEKRFCSAQADFLMRAGDAATVTAELVNPDASLEVIAFGSSTEEDYTRRARLGRSAYGLDLRFASVTGQPTLRGLMVEATVPGATLRDEE